MITLEGSWNNEQTIEALNFYSNMVDGCNLTAESKRYLRSEKWLWDRFRKSVEERRTT